MPSALENPEMKPQERSPLEPWLAGSTRYPSKQPTMPEGRRLESGKERRKKSLLHAYARKHADRPADANAMCGIAETEEDPRNLPGRRLC
jgi:hypothetical protein